MLEPGLAFGTMLGEEMPDRGQFGVARLWPGQLFDNRAQVRGLVGRKSNKGFFHELRLFFILKHFPAQHLLRSGSSGGEARADTLQQQGLHEPGSLSALLQSLREGLGRLVGEIKGVIRQQAKAAEPDPRVRSRRCIRIGMNVYADFFKETGLLQRLPTAEHGVTHNRIVFPKKPG
jgi:hypothetical protein